MQSFGLTSFRGADSFAGFSGFSSLRKNGGLTMRRQVVWLLFLLPSVCAQAAQLGNEEELLSLEAHGFVSQGFLYTTHQNNYLARTKIGSFEMTEVGLNFTKPITDKLRMGIQLFARDLGPLGNYDITADWFYLDYRWQDWLGLRVGRVKLPFGLYNEVNDVDSARVPILLPQSMYPIRSRDYLLAQNGGEIYGRYSLGKGGTLDYRGYAGAIFLEASPGATQPAEFNTTYVLGSRVMWETPLDGLRVGGSVQALELYARYAPSAAVPAPITLRIPALLWVGSLEYAAHDWLIAAEYGRWYVRYLSSNQAIFADVTDPVTSERAHLMVSYRVTAWFQPGVYYSMMFPNIATRFGRHNQQHDVAATARFDINNHWLVKLEAHYMNGTADLQTSLNDNRPLSTLANDWVLLMVKTTAHF